MIIIKRTISGILGAGVFYGLMMLMTKLTVAQPLGFPATPPVTPPSVAEGHSTGGVEAKVGGTTIKLNFNAHSGDEVKGNVMYSDSDGNKFMGKVTECYNQSGNEASFVGTVGKGNVSDTYFMVDVQDNGEGANASPDKLGVAWSNTKPDCSLGNLPATVFRGNLQVHD